MPTDTTVNNLVINKLTKAQYDAIQNPSDTELYLVPDVIDSTPTSGSDNMVTSGGVYTALSNKADASDIPTESTVSGWGFTKNAGTITGITMNGASKGTSGVVDLGTVITEHQSLTNYVQKSQTSGLLKNDGTVDTNAYITAASAPVTSVNGQTGAVSLSIPTVPSNVSAFTNDAGYTTNTGTVTSTGGTVAVNNIQVVSALPASPDANTLYLIPES